MYLKEVARVDEVVEEGVGVRRKQGSCDGVCHWGWEGEVEVAQGMVDGLGRKTC